MCHVDPKATETKASWKKEALLSHYFPEGLAQTHKIVCFMKTKDHYLYHASVFERVNFLVMIAFPLVSIQVNSMMLLRESTELEKALARLRPNY